MIDISEIIIHQLTGTITDEQQRQLDEWLSESEDNRLVYQRLTDRSHLETEWRKRKAVNWQRAAQQMTQRVNKARPLWLRPVFYRSAVAVAVVAVCGVIGSYMYIYNNVYEKQGTEIVRQQEPKAGRMMAVLTMPDGKAMTLMPEGSLKDGKAYRLLKTDTSHDGKSTEHEHTSALTLTVPRGGEFHVELEDGTEVWLNAQSRLVYPETFSETERRVQVEGEAYFKVARNESKPFYVETEGQVVRVVGTEFNVHSYAEDNTVQTTLVSGRVAMQMKGDDSREMILTPGRQAVYDKTEGGIKIRSVDTEVVTSWKDGMFVFENLDLASIMLTLSRWYDFEYEFKDEKAASTVFMGRIPRYSNFHDVIDIIEMSGGLRLRLTNRKLTIESTKR